MQRQQENRKRNALFLRQERQRKPTYRPPAALAVPTNERSQAQHRRQLTASREDIVHQLGLKWMYRKNRGSDQNRSGWQPMAKRVPQQHDRNQVQQQIDRVISGRVLPTELGVHPERQVR